MRYLARELTRVNRPQGAVGGLSAARWRMRRGEFAARMVLLRDLDISRLARFGLGSCAGCARIAADVVRGRYMNRTKETVNS